MTIPVNVLEEMTAHLRSTLPNEGCGYLAGIGTTVQKFYPITNIRNSPVEFQFEPLDQFATARDCRERGIEIIATVHSHPGGSALLSAKDREFADAQLVHLVVVPNADPILIKAFYINDQIREIPITIA